MFNFNENIEKNELIKEIESFYEKYKGSLDEFVKEIIEKFNKMQTKAYSFHSIFEELCQNVLIQ